MASLESKIQAQKNLAISYRRVGNREGALSAMKRMKLYQHEQNRRRLREKGSAARAKQLSALRQTQSANAAGLQKLKARRAAVSVKSPVTGGGGGGGGSPPSIVQTTNEHMLGVFPKDGIVATTVRKTFTGNKRGSVKKHLRQKARGAVKTVKSAVGLDGGGRRRRRTRKRRRRTRQRSRKKRGGTSCGRYMGNKHISGYIIKCPNPKYEACCETKNEKCIIVGRRGGAKAMCIPGGDEDIIDVSGGRRRRRTRKRRRRRRIGKDKRQLKRVQAQYRRFKIATGDKRFKKPKGLVKCTRVSKGKRTARIYHRRKCRKNERRLSH